VIRDRKLPYTLILFLIFVAISFFGWSSARSTLNMQEQQLFNAETNQLLRSINNRLFTCQQMLRGAVGFVKWIGEANDKIISDQDMPPGEYGICSAIEYLEPPEEYFR
jgi:hypothetical protein